MSTKDIGIYESGNGGDIIVSNNDIQLAEQLYQQMYLACFGGNVAADTQGDELPDELRFDWWGNALLNRNNPVKQFNSKTERALRNNALNSTGRIKIQMAVESDLAYLKKVANVAVSVSIPAVNKLEIKATLTKPDNKQDVVMQVLWDNSRQEMIINRII